MITFDLRSNIVLHDFDQILFLDSSFSSIFHTSDPFQVTNASVIAFIHYKISSKITQPFFENFAKITIFYLTIGRMDAKPGQPAAALHVTG